ncbi:unnamed protein product [Somion occarium]|uniref:DUF6697 domain-containing protein n=1 Tax=Somion occarium TaxID=3059160 RepID=A0ABP1E800_9APHY
MESLLSDPKLGPEMFKLLETKLKQTSAQLEETIQKNETLQREMDNLRTNKVTQGGSDDTHCCNSKKELTHLRSEKQRLNSRIVVAESSHDDQTSQISELKQALSAKVAEINHQKAQLKDYRQALASSRRDASLDCSGRLASLPQPESIVPSRHSLVPCLPKRCRDPSAALTSEAKALCSSDGILYFCDRIAWYSDADLHGFALSPASIYHVASNGGPESWTSNNEITDLIGQVKEVFYHGAGHKVHYVGTFKCAMMGDFPTLDFRHLPNLVRLNLCTKLKSANIPGERRKMRKLYNNGDTKWTFMALQCVGFNQKLYDALLAARPKHLIEAETQLPLKRARQEADNGQTHGVGKKAKKTPNVVDFDANVSETEGSESEI